MEGVYARLIGSQCNRLPEKNSPVVNRPGKRSHRLWNLSSPPPFPRGVISEVTPWPVNAKVPLLVSESGRKIEKKGEGFKL